MAMEMAVLTLWKNEGDVRLIEQVVESGEESKDKEDMLTPPEGREHGMS